MFPGVHVSGHRLSSWEFPITFMDFKLSPKYCVRVSDIKPVFGCLYLYLFQSPVVEKFEVSIFSEDSYDRILSANKTRNNTCPWDRSQLSLLLVGDYFTIWSFFVPALLLDRPKFS